MLARTHAARLEHERGRTHLRTFDVRVADRSGSLYRREVLAHESRARARATNVVDAKAATGRRCECECTTQQLTAALPSRPIDLDQPFTHTTCFSV
jgi:hypothetical protein